MFINCNYNCNTCKVTSTSIWSMAWPYQTPSHHPQNFSPTKMYPLWCIFTMVGEADAARVLTWWQSGLRCMINRTFNSSWFVLIVIVQGWQCSLIGYLGWQMRVWWMGIYHRGGICQGGTWFDCLGHMSVFSPLNLLCTCTHHTHNIVFLFSFSSVIIYLISV